MAGLAAVVLLGALLLWHGRSHAPAPARGAADRWPGEASTGVPSGTRLRQSGPLVVSQPGAVVRDLDVHGCVQVLAPFVTIERSRISGSCATLVENHSTDLTIRDTELVGVDQVPNGQAIGYGNYTALRVNVHGTGDGLRANGDVLIKDSWVHDLKECADCHNDGVQVSQGTNVHIAHNRIENANGQTSAVLVKADQGDISSLDVEGNLLDGGGYTVYLLPARYALTDVRVVDNVFGRTFHAQGGRYGPADVKADVSWMGNTWADSGAPLQLGSAVVVSPVIR